MHANLNTTDFRTAFRGKFSGILEWPQLDTLWATLRHSEKDWYIYAIGEPVPDTVATREELSAFIEEIDSLLRKEHQEEYCGIVYADNPRDPEFIKIYDPNNLGVVCGFSDNPPLPGWVLTTTKPEPLEGGGPLPANRKRWWQKIWN